MSAVVDDAQPSVLEDLSDDECALWAILSDRSGVDLAEFAFVDENKDDGCFRLYPYQWCFAGETGVLTPGGVKPIRELVGPTDLLTHIRGRPRWVAAEVRCFGRQPLVEVGVQRHDLDRVIRTTAEHRWFADPRKRSLRDYPEIRTLDLRPGMYLRSVLPPRRHNLRITPYGVTHGLVWGDGTREKNGGSTLRLWGEKLECAHFLVGGGVEENRPDVAVPGRRWSLLPRSFKDPVSLTEAPSYLFSWLAGYFAADGSVAPDGTCQLVSVSRLAVALARDVCIRLGITVGPITRIISAGRGGYGPPGVDSWRATLRSCDLPSEFFLRPTHRAKWERRPPRTYNARDWKVTAVRPTPDIEDVFCAVVPGSHSFVLDGYILTGNCWWRTETEREVDQCARSVGKSERVKARACAFPFSFPGQEMVIVAPEGIHVDALTDRIEAQVQATRLLREIRIHGRAGITHRPFKVLWQNGSRLLTRLPQRSGIGVKGIHPAVLEVDEGQDISEKAWPELSPVVRWEVEGARWAVHGVSKGVRDHFYDISEGHLSGEWLVHRITAMHSPNFDEEARARAIADYGSKDDPDYKRNIKGEHGDAANRIFVLSKFMSCVDTREASAYNLGEYFQAAVTPERIADRSRRSAEPIELATDAHVAAMLELLDFPASHARHEVKWMGMDVGLVGDPSEILVFSEYVPDAAERREHTRAEIAVPEPGESRFRLLTRVKLVRIPEPLQIELIMWMIDFYRPRAFAMDGTGIGLPVFQGLQKRAGTSRLVVFEPPPEAGQDALVAFAETRAKAKRALTVIKNYAFSAKIVVDFDAEKLAELGPNATIDQMVEKAGIKRLAKDQATDNLRTLVDNNRLLLPDDREVISQMNGQTWSHSAEPIDAYGRRRMSYSKGVFHVLDAARMFALGAFQHAIEEILQTPPKREPILDRF